MSPRMSFDASSMNPSSLNLPQFTLDRMLVVLIMRGPAITLTQSSSLRDIALMGVLRVLTVMRTTMQTPGVKISRNTMARCTMTWRPGMSKPSITKLSIMNRTKMLVRGTKLSTRTTKTGKMLNTTTGVVIPMKTSMIPPHTTNKVLTTSNMHSQSTRKNIMFGMTLKTTNGPNTMTTTAICTITITRQVFHNMKILIHTIKQ
mmetsp:Transcript_9479/g.15526  ORF Transcript_9479/g.15526 Transcript_9479/m.15526 type:complete len:203 (-) Transcript_9479:883-1491(-)